MASGRGGNVKKFLSVAAVTALCAACGGGQPAPEPEATSPTAEAPAPESLTPDTGAPSAKPATPPAATAAAKPAPPPAPKFREVTLPEGTTLQLRLQSAIASDTSKVEEPVRAQLAAAVTADGATVLPAGTAVVGNVTEVERSGRVKGRARLAYRFTSLTRDGERYDIATAPIAHEAEGSKGDDAKKIAIGAGVGAAIGAIAGGGSGAATGAAIGGGAGTGVVLATRGEEVRLEAGAAVTTRLTSPLTVRIPN